MGRGLLILLLVVSTDIFVLRCVCERPSIFSLVQDHPKDKSKNEATVEAANPSETLAKHKLENEEIVEAAKENSGKDEPEIAASAEAAEEKGSEENEAEDSAGDEKPPTAKKPAQIVSNKGVALGPVSTQWEDEDDYDPLGESLKKEGEKGDNDDDDEAAVGQDSDHILSQLGNFYKPGGGEMSLLLNEMNVSGQKANKAAKEWTKKSHEAIKAVHHVIVKSTNDAQSTLFKDGLRLNQAIRGNLKNETGKMEALSLDGRARQRILQQHGDGSRILLPPPDHPDEMLGKNVVCNREYRGRNQLLVHDQKGVIVSFVPGTNKWRIRLRNPEAKAFMPTLRRDEFEIVGGDEEVDGVRGNGKPTPKHSAEWIAAMETYHGHHVRIDHLPEHVLEANAKAEELWMHKIGSVVDYRHVQDQDPEFQVKINDEDEEAEGLNEDENRPWLVLDRDFHLVSDLKGKEVQVRRVHVGHPGAEDYKPGIIAKGVVEDWHSDDGGYYTVKIPERVVKVKSSEVLRDRSRWTNDEVLQKSPHKSKHVTTAVVVVGSKVSFTDPETVGTDHEVKLTGEVRGLDTSAETYDVQAELSGEHYHLFKDDLVLLESPGPVQAPHKGEAQKGQVVAFVDPKSSSENAEEHSLHGIVESYTPHEEFGKSTYNVLANDGEHYELPLEAFTLVKGDALKNMKVNFGEEGALKEGTIESYEANGAQPEQSHYDVHDKEGKDYHLLYGDFTVIGFPARPVGPDTVAQTSGIGLPSHNALEFAPVEDGKHVQLKVNELDPSVRDYVGNGQGIVVSRSPASPENLKDDHGEYTIKLIDDARAGFSPLETVQVQRPKFDISSPSLSEVITTPQSLSKSEEDLPTHNALEFAPVEDGKHVQLKVEALDPSVRDYVGNGQGIIVSRSPPSPENLKVDQGEYTIKLIDDGRGGFSPLETVQVQKPKFDVVNPSSSALAPTKDVKSGKEIAFDFAPVEDGKRVQLKVDALDPSVRDYVGNGKGIVVSRSPASPENPNVDQGEYTIKLTDDGRGGFSPLETVQVQRSKFDMIKSSSAVVAPPSGVKSGEDVALEFAPVEVGKRVQLKVDALDPSVRDYVGNGQGVVESRSPGSPENLNVDQGKYSIKLTDDGRAGFSPLEKVEVERSKFGMIGSSSNALTQLSSVRSEKPVKEVRNEISTKRES